MGVTLLIQLFYLIFQTDWLYWLKKHFLIIIFRIEFAKLKKNWKVLQRISDRTFTFFKIKLIASIGSSTTEIRTWMKTFSNFGNLLFFSSTRTFLICFIPWKFPRLPVHQIHYLLLFSFFFVKVIFLLTFYLLFFFSLERNCWREFVEPRFWRRNSSYYPWQNKIFNKRHDFPDSDIAVRRRHWQFMRYLRIRYIRI